MLSHLGAWHAIAARHGDGLRPELIRLLERHTAASRVDRTPTVSDVAEEGRSAQPGPPQVDQSATISRTPGDG
jgi:hypothetical protein